jgi:hypothetical protein
MTKISLVRRNLKVRPFKSRWNRLFSRRNRALSNFVLSPFLLVINLRFVDATGLVLRHHVFALVQKVQGLRRGDVR